MKSRTDSLHSSSKSNLSMIPDFNTLNSSQSSHQLLLIKKKTKSTERLPDPESPFSSTKAVSLTKTKESSRLIKNASKILTKKDLKPKERYLVSSNSNKLIKPQNSLPMLNCTRFTEPSKTSTFQSIISGDSKKPLKHLCINEDLQINEKVLTEVYDYKAKSWLENIISIKERKTENLGLTESLKFCNCLVRDVIVRLKQSGKENESILMEKIWSIHFEAIDEYIEKLEVRFLDAEKALQNLVKRETQDMRVQCEERVQMLEMQIEKLKFELSIQEPNRGNLEVGKVEPVVEKVYLRLDELAEMFRSRPESRMHRKRFSLASANLLLGRNIKLKNKRSMEAFQPISIEIQED